MIQHFYPQLDFQGVSERLLVITDHMCNPTQGKDDTIDDNWKCYQYCEEPPKCAAWKDQNDTMNWQGPSCYCKNGRGNHTVGRVHRESYHGHHGPPPPAPAWWPQAQCSAVGLVPSHGFCINGTTYKTLKDATPAECVLKLNMYEDSSIRNDDSSLQK